MVDTVDKGLELWFSERLQTLDCTLETRAYVVGVLSKRWREDDDMSKQSIVLAYYKANLEGSFAGYQRIGDWVFWSSTVVPEFNEQNLSVVETIGKASYISCHRILQGKWKVYEDLANNLLGLSRDVRERIKVANLPRFTP